MPQIHFGVNPAWDSGQLTCIQYPRIVRTSIELHLGLLIEGYHSCNCQETLPGNDSYAACAFIENLPRNRAEEDCQLNIL